jgi:hypothetical protein
MAQAIWDAPSSAPPRRGTGGLVLALCLLAVGVSLIARMFHMSEDTYNVWGGALIGPMLFAISLPILAREARKLGNQKLLKLFVLALLCMFVGALLRYFVTYQIYDGQADASGYHGKGSIIAEQISSGELGRSLESFTRTDFIRFFTGVVYTLIGPSRLGGFLFYAWLAYWGLFLFFKAFLVAMGPSDSRSYGRLVFFYPSLLYWPATIGKDAWMVLWIGLASLGVAHAMQGRTLRGLSMAAGGMALAGIVRVPLAGMVGIALAGAYLVKKPSKSLKQLGPIVKVASVAAMVVVVLFMLRWSGDFLKADLTDPSSVSAALEQTSARADHGGSEFDPVVVRGPQDVPLAIATVLYRPFLFEAHNLQALIAAIEGMILLIITLVRWRWLVEAFKNLRRRPYLMYAAVFSIIFIIAFASFPNFGLLARQRVQLFPLLFVLLCVSPGGADERELDRAQSG